MLCVFKGQDARQYGNGGAMDKATEYARGGINFLSPEELGLFGESLDRAIKCDNFLDIFYERLKQSSNEVAEIFKDVNMPALHEKVLKTLRLATLANTDPQGIDRHLQELGKYHQGLSIPQSMYQAWQNALVSVLHSCDPEFGPELDRIWHQVLEVAIYKMHQGYEAAD